MRSFFSIERLDLWHSKLCRKGEVQHPGVEWRFSMLYHGVHGDWSSAFYRFLHVADFLLDVPETLLPRPLLDLLLIKDGHIASIVPTVRAPPPGPLRRGVVPLTGYPPSSQGFLSPPWARTWDHELRYPFEVVPTTNWATSPVGSGNYLEWVSKLMIPGSSPRRRKKPL